MKLIIKKQKKDWQISDVSCLKDRMKNYLISLAIIILYLNDIFYCWFLKWKNCELGQSYITFLWILVHYTT